MTPFIALTDHLRRIIEQLNDPLIEVDRYQIDESLESINITLSIRRLGISVDRTGKPS